MTVKAMSAQRVFDGERFHYDAAVVWNDQTIVDIVPKSELSGTVPCTDFADKLIAPGFIDLQVNGGGDVMFNSDTSVEGIDMICRAHRKHGTAYLLPTLISASPQQMKQALLAAEQAIEGQVRGVLGVHLEGPWLNKNKKGAHDADKFYSPSVTQLEAFPWLNNGVNFVTLAAENVALESLQWLRDHDVVVSCGHSNATSDSLPDSKLKLVNGFTHLFNAMSPLEGREPGVVGTALMTDHAWCSIIVDGIHVAPQNVQLAKRVKPDNKLLIVTDAMASVGSVTNRFVLDGEEISVQDGRLVNSQGALAGAHIGMDQSVANVIEWGFDEAEALRMASTYPALALNLSELGLIKPGYHAAATVLNSDYSAHAVMVDGEML
ncbi:N-acetylglucosamine-6-phosphate deacetylase [Vibrio parahaemolyticus]|uniref:N-acetylglucosamine-6-phosphate deacetylase n=1 Tax=Vibrio mediterranei TaxID=689 RepID=UPI0040697F77